MIEIFSAEPFHAAMIEPREFHTADPNWRQNLYFSIKRRPSWTIANDQKIAAIVGVTHLFEHTVEAWSMITDEVKNCRVGFARAVDRLIQLYAKEYNIKRAQMLVPMTCQIPMHFSLFLGFKYEGTMEFYGPNGEDYAMMGRIF